MSPVIVHAQRRELLCGGDYRMVLALEYCTTQQALEIDRSLVHRRNESTINSENKKFEQVSAL